MSIVYAGWLAGWLWCTNWNGRNQFGDVILVYFLAILSAAFHHHHVNTDSTPVRMWPLASGCDVSDRNFMWWVDGSLAEV